MSNRYNDIRDDEFRVIGQSSAPSVQNSSGNGRKKWPWILAALMISAIIITVCLLNGKEEDTDLVNAAYDPVELAQEPQITEIQRLGNYDESEDKAYTEHLKDTINDIPLNIYIPHNAVPELCVGRPDISDKSIVLATQAADIRADNGKIVGAYVIKGKPLSWGLSKKGYCGIIDGKITIGVADNSPLFEEATEKEGFFFRQYPLVDNGTLVENELKGKSIRKAICDRKGEIMVIMTETPESLHDFAQALIDLKVDNAIYLVGGQSYGFYNSIEDERIVMTDDIRYNYRYINFILWKAQ